MPCNIFKEQCTRGEANFPAFSPTAMMRSKFYQLHAKFAITRMERASEDSSKVEGVGFLSELPDALRQAGTAKDTYNSDSQLSLATQTRPADGTEFGNPSGSLNNINKQGPPSRLSAPKRVEKRPSQTLRVKAQANARKKANITKHMNNQPTPSSLPQGLPQGQDFDIIGHGNAAYEKQQTTKFNKPTFSSSQQGHPEAPHFNIMEPTSANHTGYFTKHTSSFNQSNASEISHAPSKGQDFGLMGQANVSNAGFAMGRVNNFDLSTFSSNPQGDSLSPRAHASMPGMINGIDDSGDELANDMFQAMLEGGMLTDTAITTAPATSALGCLPGQQLVPTDHGFVSTEQQLPDMLNWNLTRETAGPTTPVAPGSALDQARQYSAAEQSGYNTGVQQPVPVFHLGLSEQVPIPTTKAAPGWTPGPAGQYNTFSQGGINPGNRTLFGMQNESLTNPGPIPTMQMAPGLLYNVAGNTNDFGHGSIHPGAQPVLDTPNENIHIQTLPLTIPGGSLTNPVQQYNGFVQDGFNTGSQQDSDALNRSIASQSMVPTSQATPGPALYQPGQLDGMGQGSYSLEDQNQPTLSDEQASIPTSMPMSQTAFGQVFNGPTDFAGQGEIESGHQYPDAAANGHAGISQQAPNPRSQKSSQPANNSAEQLNRVGDNSVSDDISGSAAGRDNVGQSAPPTLGGKSSSQKASTGKPDVSRAQRSAEDDMNLPIAQYLAGVLDDNVLNLDQDLPQALPEQRHSPRGEMEGVAHGEDQPVLADEVGSSSDPDQEPSHSASSFQDEDALFDEFANFSRGFFEEPIIE